MPLHRADDRCLTYELECLEHVCFGLLSKLLNIVDYYEQQHPQAKELASSCCYGATTSILPSKCGGVVSDQSYPFLAMWK